MNRCRPDNRVKEFSPSKIFSLETHYRVNSHGSTPDDLSIASCDPDSVLFRQKMPSRSFDLWNSERRQALDQIVAAHVAVGGPGPGRRYATQQINQAYAMLLS